MRGEILSATAQKLLAYSEKVKAALEGAVYCIAAPKDMIDRTSVDEILEI